MIVQTKLSDQSEQFELDGACYVGRRVLWLPCGDFEAEPEPDVYHNFYLAPPFASGLTMCLVLFRLDYGKGEVFVDPAILKPYQRPENLQAKDA